MIVLPAAAQKALVDGTGLLYTLLEVVVSLDPVEDAQGVWQPRSQPAKRWATGTHDISYDGKTWSRLSPYIEARDSGSIQQEGTISVILSDIDRSLYKNFRAHGERGNEVDLLRVLRYTDDNDAEADFVTSRFKGVTLRTVSFREDEAQGYLLELECVDRAAFPHRERGVMTDNGYQRSIDPDDNSHIVATQARQIRWQRK